jgi:hypothetical protein
MSLNINNFSTSETSMVLAKIFNILYKFEQTESCDITPKVYIYGGVVRDIIQHHFNPTEKFTLKDVNIWLDCSPYLTHQDFDYDVWNDFFDELQSQLDNYYGIKFEQIQNKYYDLSNQFELVKFKINGITFNVCTAINMPNFHNLCDYTVNNLYIDIHGNLFQRAKSQYSVDDIINHIRLKKLVNILNEDYFTQLCKFYNEDFEDEDEESYEICNDDFFKPSFIMENMLFERENKMMKHGYLINIPVSVSI